MYLGMSRNQSNVLASSSEYIGHDHASIYAENILSGWRLNMLALPRSKFV
jgi:hypothetical protein